MKSIALPLLLLCLLSPTAKAAAAEPVESNAPASLDLQVKVVPDHRSMEVTGTALLPASNKPLGKICFQLLAQMKDVKVEVLEPKSVAGPLHPRSLGTVQDQANYTADLPMAVPAGTPVKVSFSYHGGDKTAFVFHIGPDGSYGCGSEAAWYPEFGPVVELNGKSVVNGQALVTGKIQISVPADQTAIVTGAEKGPYQQGDQKSYSYTLAQPIAASFAVAKYTVLKSNHGVPVSLYTLGGMKNPDEMLKGIRSVVDELTGLYGPFPFPTFAIVEVSESSIEGAGFDGAGCAGFMLSGTDILRQGFNMAFFGHEIGHQWWGNLVTHATEEKGNDLLDEALAQYGSLRCVHDLMGEPMAEQYRRSGFPGYAKSQCGGYYLAMSQAGIDQKPGDMEDGKLLSHELADEKGFLVYDMLRQEIGDKVFHRALKAVTSQYAFREITWSQFQKEVEKSAGKDLAWFWNQWFERLGAPSLDLKWSQDGNSVSGTVVQIGDPYRMSLPICVQYADGHSDTFNVSISGENTPFHRDCNGQVIDVKIDPHFETLYYTPELRAIAEKQAPSVKARWQGK